MALPAGGELAGDLPGGKAPQRGAILTGGGRFEPLGDPKAQLREVLVAGGKDFAAVRARLTGASAARQTCLAVLGRLAADAGALLAYALQPGPGIGGRGDRHHAARPGLEFP